jgi:hypothetical protein
VREFRFSCHLPPRLWSSRKRRRVLWERCPEVSEEPAGTVHWVTDRGSGFLQKSVQFKEQRQLTSQNIVVLFPGRPTPIYSTTKLYTVHLHSPTIWSTYTHHFLENLFEIPQIVTALIYIYYSSVLLTGSQVALSP